MTKEEVEQEQVLNGFTEMMKGFFQNQDLEVPNFKKPCKQEPCEDCISRQSVIDGINEYFNDEYYQRTSIQDCMDCLIEDVIKDIPPVTPQLETGNWVIIDDCEHFIAKCSECGEVVDSRMINDYPYCHNCGAKMVELQESE